MNYQIKRECWNEKTYNGYEDNPYWRIDFRGLSFGLHDNGKLWSIGNLPINEIDILDIKTIIKECKLNCLDIQYENITKLTRDRDYCE